MAVTYALYENAREMSMRLKIDYDYAITFVEYRHQNASTRWGRAEVDVDIRELSSSEASLVAKIGQKPDTYSHSGKKFSYKENGEPRELRVFDDRYYVEMYDLDEFKSKIEGGFAGTLFEKNKPITVDNRGNRVTHTTGETIQKTAPFNRPHRTVNDDKGLKKGKIFAKLADQMIIVEGTLYREVPEPVFCTKASYGGVPLIVTRDRSEFSSSGYEEHSIYSLLSDYGGITCNLNNATLIIEQLAEAKRPFLEIYDPSAFTFDGDNRDAMKIADGLHDDLARDVGRLPRPFLKIWFEFNNAYKDANDRVTERLIAVVKDLASVRISDTDEANIRITAARRGDSRHGRKSTDDLASARHHFSQESQATIQENANKFLRRWEQRNMNDTWPILSGPKSTVSVNSNRVVELGSKGHVVDCCALAGMSKQSALDIVGSGMRIVASIGGLNAIATIDDNDTVTIVSSPSDEHEPMFEKHFAEFVRVTNEAKLQENELLAFDAMDFGSN